MVLQSSGTIWMSQIRDEFYNSGPPWSLYGTDNNNLMNLNYYRGKYFYVPGTDSYQQFSTGTIYFSDFYGKQGRCQCLCDCLCGDCP